MQSSLIKKNWWIVLVVGGILALGVTLVQQRWLPDYDIAAFLVALIILGVAFYWVYFLDKQVLWWSLIPAMAMVVLLVTGFVAYFTPKDASGSSPYGVVTMGLGAAIMGFVLRHPRAKLVMYIIAMIALAVGFLMLPLDLVWKILLVVAEVLLTGYLAWQVARQPVNK